MNKARPPYDPDNDAMADKRPRKKSGAGKVLLILALVFGGIGLMCCLSTVLFYGQMKDGMADGISEAISLEVDRSKLSSDQKTKIKAQITRVQEGFKAGDISFGQVTEIFKGLGEGPMFPLALIWEAFQKHVPNSHLSAVEQQDATLSYQRFARGAIEKSIPMTKVREVVQLVTNKQDNSSSRRKKNQPVVKQKMSAEEIDAFVEAMTKAADDANISEEAYEVDIAAELKKTVDEALKK